MFDCSILCFGRKMAEGRPLFCTLVVVTKCSVFHIFDAKILLSKSVLVCHEQCFLMHKWLQYRSVIKITSDHFKMLSVQLEYFVKILAMKLLHLIVDHVML